RREKRGFTVSSQNGHDSTTLELDVRGLHDADQRRRVVTALVELPVGGKLVVVGDNAPEPLLDELDADYAGGVGWAYLDRTTDRWRVEITRRASTPLPRVLVDTTTLTADPAAHDEIGAVWKLQVRERDLDSNIVALPPGGTIDAHTGPDLDVLIHVLAGAGWLTTELDSIDLAPGVLLWMPRRSRRQITAGTDGLRYLTVHRRRAPSVLQVGARPPEE
ncbi:MAG TPA: DUF2249 domain-containing protein, partial [Actinopolymorphaceae bacterium]